MLVTALNLQQYLPAFVSEPAFYVGIAAWYLHRAVTKGFQQTSTTLDGVTEHLEEIQQRIDALEKLFLEEYGRVA